MRFRVQLYDGTVRHLTADDRYHLAFCVRNILPRSAGVVLRIGSDDGIYMSDDVTASTKIGHVQDVTASTQVQSI